jgi:hypothetical protein
MKPDGIIIRWSHSATGTIRSYRRTANNSHVFWDYLAWAAGVAFPQAAFFRPVMLAARMAGPGP